MSYDSVNIGETDKDRDEKSSSDVQKTACIRLTLLRNKNAKVDLKNYTFWFYPNRKENFSIVSDQNVMDIPSHIASAEKSAGYFVYSYSRIASIERALSYNAT